MKRLEFETLESTNDFAKMYARSGDWNKEPVCIVAQEQTKGRGRLGRSWSSEKGNGIYMSLLLKPELLPEQVSPITLVMALVVRKALEKVAGLETGIKWPNDLVSDGRKICGILTEMGMQEAKAEYVVIGVGINVGQKEFPEEIKATATSLYLERPEIFTGAKQELKNRIVEEILKEWQEYYKKFCRTGDLSAIIDEYNANCINAGEEVCVLEKGENRTGTALGIDPVGRLIVETKRGREYISSGEVSVRGVYGYV